MYPQVAKKWFEIARRTDLRPLLRFHPGSDGRKFGKTYLNVLTIDLKDYGIFSFFCV